MLLQHSKSQSRMRMNLILSHTTNLTRAKSTISRAYREFSSRNSLTNTSTLCLYPTSLPWEIIFLVFSEKNFFFIYATLLAPCALAPSFGVIFLPSNVCYSSPPLLRKSFHTPERTGNRLLFLAMPALAAPFLS